MPQPSGGQGPATSSARSWRTLLWRLLPWLVSTGVLVILLRRYSLSEILATLQRGDAIWLLPLAAVGSVSSLLVMATADWLLFRAALAPLPWTSAVRGRGGTGLMMAANYGAGQGSYGLWVARVTGASAGTTTGIIAYLILCDLSSVCLIAAASLWLSGLTVAEEIRGLALGLAPLVGLGLVLLALAGPALLPKLEARAPLLRRLSILSAPWALVPARVYLQSLLLRILNVLASAIFWYLAARSLQVHAPIVAFLTYLPLIYLVGSLPVNVGPFGVVQIAWLHFFSAYAADEQIVALQVVFGALLVIGFAVRALPFISRVVREIEEGARPADTDSTGAPAS